MEKYFEIFLKYLNVLKSPEMGEGDNLVNKRLSIVLEDIHSSVLMNLPVNSKT